MGRTPTVYIGMAPLCVYIPFCLWCTRLLASIESRYKAYIPTGSDGACKVKVRGTGHFCHIHACTCTGKERPLYWLLGIDGQCSCCIEMKEDRYRTEGLLVSIEQAKAK